MPYRLPDGRPWFAVPRSPWKRPSTRRTIVAGLVSGVVFGIAQYWSGDTSWRTAVGIALTWNLVFWLLALFASRRGVPRRSDDRLDNGRVS